MSAATASAEPGTGGGKLTAVAVGGAVGAALAVGAADAVALAVGLAVGFALGAAEALASADAVGSAAEAVVVGVGSAEACGAVSNTPRAAIPPNALSHSDLGRCRVIRRDAIPAHAPNGPDCFGPRHFCATAAQDTQATREFAFL